MSNFNFLILVPAYGGTVKNAAVLCLINLVQTLSASKIGCSLQIIDKNDIAEVRNIYASLVLQEEVFSHLLCIDHDMIFGAQTITNMINVSVPIIGCSYPFRELDLAKVLSAVRNGQDDKKAISSGSKFSIKNVLGISSNNIAEVDGVGTGLMLIERRVFSELANDVRKQTTHRRISGLNKPLYGFFDRIMVDNELLGEDISFCYRWRKKGGQIFALLNEDIGHIGSYTYRAKFMG